MSITDGILDYLRSNFNGYFFDQIDGVSMGSPLDPTFANFFIDALENKIMTKLKRLGVKVWFRYRKRLPIRPGPDTKLLGHRTTLAAKFEMVFICSNTE